jgi:predicted transcriptional regulator
VLVDGHSGEHEGALLMFLLSETMRGPVSVDEVAREMRRDPTDALHSLHAAGLIHRLGDFVWASRAAVLADEVGI